MFGQTKQNEDTYHPLGSPSVLNNSTAWSASSSARMPLLDRSEQQYLQLSSLTAFSPKSSQNSSSAIRFGFDAMGLPDLDLAPACEAWNSARMRLESGERGAAAADLRPPPLDAARSSYCER